MDKGPPISLSLTLNTTEINRSFRLFGQRKLYFQILTPDTRFCEASSNEEMHSSKNNIRFENVNYFMPRGKAFQLCTSTGAG